MHMAQYIKELYYLKIKIVLYLTLICGREILKDGDGQCQMDYHGESEEENQMSSI